LRKLALTIRLLYRLLTIGLLCLFASADDVSAAEASIKLIQNGVRENNLVMQFQAEEVFSEKVIKFLNRGFTIRIQYSVELWRSRRYWFDHLDKNHSISYQINFAPLEKRYACLKSQQGAAITSKLDQELDTIIQWATLIDPPLIISPVKLLEPGTEYYYNIQIIVATLTGENIKDLRKWLDGIGTEEDENSTITDTTFRVAMDFISSRNQKKHSVRSEKFRPRDLPKISD